LQVEVGIQPARRCRGIGDDEGGALGKDAVHVFSRLHREFEAGHLLLYAGDVTVIPTAAGDARHRSINPHDVGGIVRHEQLELLQQVVEHFLEIERGDDHLADVLHRLGLLALAALLFKEQDALNGNAERTANGLNEVQA